LFTKKGYKSIISKSRFDGISVRPVIKIKYIPEPITNSYKIMTYNIRYWNGENDSSNQGNKSWIVRKEKVFEMINKHKPDICGL
jgi:hypothetical protein